MNRCAYCGHRAYVHMDGADARGTAFRLDVCPECGPPIAARLNPVTVRLTPYPDHRTVGRAIRLAVLWAVIILALPVLAGMIWAAIEMIIGR